jgi:hypothetical protein
MGPDQVQTAALVQPCKLRSRVIRSRSNVQDMFYGHFAKNLPPPTSSPTCSRVRPTLPQSPTKRVEQSESRRCASDLVPSWPRAAFLIGVPDQRAAASTASDNHAPLPRRPPTTDNHALLPRRPPTTRRRLVGLQSPHPPPEPRLPCSVSNGRRLAETSEQAKRIRTSDPWQRQHGGERMQKRLLPHARPEKAG